MEKNTRYCDWYGCTEVVEKGSTYCTYHKKVAEKKDREDARFVVAKNDDKPRRKWWQK